MIEKALQQLIEIQNQADPKYFTKGLFPSVRRYNLGLSRADDNVYFTAFILHILKKNRSEWASTPLFEAISSLISKAEQSLKVYRHGKDDISFNFYRKDGFFPNGWLLHRFNNFEPANDADDSSVAFLGLDFGIAKAKELQKKFAFHANGKRNRWVKRIPRNYRYFETYNTWLGTDKLYVDLDFGVLCNILQFVAKYKLEITYHENEAVNFIERAINSGDYLNSSALISAWYPDQAVILYFISKVVKTGYFTFSPKSLNKLKCDALAFQNLFTQPVQKVLIEIALSNMGVKQSTSTVNLTEILNQTDFSIGVVPIFQPWNHELAQGFGGISLLRITYHCPALQLAIWLERAFIDLKSNEKNKKFTQD